MSYDLGYVDTYERYLLFIVEQYLEVSVQTTFFCSTLLRCDLRKKKVPGRAPYSQHIIIRNWT